MTMLPAVRAGFDGRPGKRPGRL